MKSISVRQSPGVLSLALRAPLPQTAAEWQSVAVAVHHACLSRTARDGLVLELEGVEQLSNRDIEGIVNCLINAVRTAGIPCRVRVVSSSKAVREAFDVCADADLGACISHEEAVAQLANSEGAPLDS